MAELQRRLDAQLLQVSYNNIRALKGTEKDPETGDREILVGESENLTPQISLSLTFCQKQLFSLKKSLILPEEYAMTLCEARTSQGDAGSLQDLPPLLPVTARLIESALRQP